MRLGIAAVLLVLPLAGCADNGSDPGDEPREAGKVVLVSMTAAGGDQLGPTLQYLANRSGVRTFVAAFDDRSQADLRAAIKAYDVREGYQLFGGVAYVGCGVPDYAKVEGEGKNAHLVPGPTHDENIECFAPVTTVGLVAIPLPRQ